VRVDGDIHSVRKPWLYLQKRHSLIPARFTFVDAITCTGVEVLHRCCTMMDGTELIWN
jgi:hypothetical protein